MDSEVSMICTEVHESFWVQISDIWEVASKRVETMGIFRKESIGMAVPITNSYGRELGKEKVVLQ